MGKTWQRVYQPLLIPAGVARRTKKRLPLVVVDAVNAEALAMEKSTNFRTD
jgi:hypothetical protein